MRGLGGGYEGTLVISKRQFQCVVGKAGASLLEVGGSKPGMAAERRPMLCTSDKDRLAPQVSSVRGIQAPGQGSCTNRPAYKHLIITQAEEAL